jgi:hypothetical protein
MSSGLLQCGMVHSYQRNQHLNANNPLELTACSSWTFAKGCAASPPFGAAAKFHVVDLTISNLSFSAPIPMMDCVPYDTISVGIGLIIYSAEQSKESESKNFVCKSEKNRLSKFFSMIADISNFVLVEAPSTKVKA